MKDLDLKEALVTAYPTIIYQPIYFLVNTFEDAKRKMQLVIIMSNIHVCTKCCHYSEWGSTIKKPFHLQYMPCYESVQVLTLIWTKKKGRSYFLQELRLTKLSLKQWKPIEVLLIELIDFNIICTAAFSDCYKV